MSSLDEINRLVNQSLRVVNSLANRLASSSMVDRDAALSEAADSILHLEKLSRLVASEDPSLEYHFDPTRAPSALMRKVSELVEIGDEYVQQGKIAEARDVFAQAIAFEPHPLVYEMIEKRIASLPGP